MRYEVMPGTVKDMNRKIQKRNHTKRIMTCILFWLSFLLYHPLFVFAAEEAKSKPKEKIGPITAIIFFVVTIVVAYFVYHAMYGQWGIIGTSDGIRQEITRRLMIPLIVGVIVAGIVVKILQILGFIIKIILIIGLILFIVAIIYGYVEKKKHSKGNSAETTDQNTGDDVIAESIDVQNTKIEYDEKGILVANKENRLTGKFRTFCPECGRELKLNSKFCSNCGKDLNDK